MRSFIAPSQRLHQILCEKSKHYLAVRRVVRGSQDAPATADSSRGFVLEKNRQLESSYRMYIKDGTAIGKHIYGLKKRLLRKDIQILGKIVFEAHRCLNEKRIATQWRRVNGQLATIANHFFRRPQARSASGVCTSEVLGREMASAFASIHDGNTYFLLINGKFSRSESGKTITGETPFDGTPTYTIQAATKAEIDRAYESAARAQREWRRVALWKRAEIVHKAATILREHVDEIATVILREVGKNRKSAVSEVLRTADLCDYTAEEGLRLEGQLLVSDSYPGQPRNKLCLVQRVPLGVVLAQGPFNYPCNLTGSKVAPALMAGNACVVKGPTQGAVSALYLTAAFHFAGVPAGVVNFVSGRGSEIGDYLVTHPLCNCISFTGGNIGLEVAKKAHMIPMQMELGGKDAAIVCDDADLDLATKCIVSGAFSYSGQRCTAVKLVLAVESIADELVKKVVERTRALTVGHPEDDCEVTAVINKAAADYAESLAMDAKEKGAKFLLEYKREGNLIHPLVVDQVNESMKLAWEEPFAPVLPVMRVKDERAAVAFANRLRYGLQGCVFTRDVNRAITLSSEITAGTIQINGAPARGPDHFLFLGHKDSGINAQGAKWSIEAMTKLKSVVINLPQEAYMVAN